MKKEKDYINVYWAPAVYYDVSNSASQEWEMLYPEPVNLYNSLVKKQVKNNNVKRSFFVCPAVKQNFKNTYVIKNAVYSEYEYASDPFPTIKQYSDFALGSKIERPSAILDGPLFSFSLSYIFFSDESLEAHFTAPYFHKSTYTQYGSIIPGTFNIGLWFRPYNFEVQMWNKDGKFILQEDDPLFYVRFETDKKIKLHRFKYNQQLHAYSNESSNSSLSMRQNVQLFDRYRRFKEARMNESILKEIQKTSIGENKNV